ncbi:MAG: SusC/RagA family TonB-linked outer membrane protein [Ferruginibacter sp.]
MMKKLMLLLLIVMSSHYLVAQSRTITGQVTDESNSAPIAGAAIKVKGTSAGTSADDNGRFTLNVSSGNISLEVSSIGFEIKVVAVSSNTQNVTITLKRETGELNNVVVTALGITRQAKTLTYSTQTIKNDALTTVKTPNLINSLNGKVSGVQINRTSGGVGGSARIVVRGDKSTRNSQPLFVIDGQPITNPTGTPPNVDIYSSLPDNGDVLSSLNPDDIESINFLKGSAASALYGSIGSNGVIVITTRKGRSGVSKIDFSSSVTFDKAYGLPKLQHSYLQTTAPSTTSAGSAESWGAKGSSPAHEDNFFQTGTTFVNGITLSSGNERSNNFFSYSNTYNKGVVPTSNFTQNNINFRNSSKFFDNKLTFDANVMGSLQNVTNRVNPGMYFSPLLGVYLFPRGLDFNEYKENYEYQSPSRYLNAQNWWNINLDKGFSGSDQQQNPYWVLNRNKVTTDNKNLYTAVSLNYALNPHLNIQARGNYNYFNSDARRNVYATTQATISGTNGKLYNNTLDSRTYYADLILRGDNAINSDLSINYLVGTSIQDNKKKTDELENALLVYPNIFTLSNLTWPGQSGGGVHNKTLNYRSQLQSIFASAQFGYKDRLFVDLTDRHEWSSTLAYTPKDNYNYYSVGVSAVLSEMLKMPSSINYSKVRASYGIVGNGIESNRSHPQPYIDAGSLIQPTTSPATKFGLYLQPELNKTIEIGTEWAFLNNRLLFNATWYKSNVLHQFIGNIGVPPGSLSDITAGNVDFCAGNVQNTGIEATLSYKVIDKKDFQWTTTVNASANKNKIKELFPSQVPVDPKTLFALTGGGFNYLVKGGSFGDIYGTTFKRDDQGRILVDADGVPSRNEDKTYLGNPNPKFILGWNNSFSYKHVTLGFLIDGKFGGKVLSLSEPFYDAYGVSQRSADARDAGGVVIQNAVIDGGGAWTGKTDAQKYYSKIGGRNEIDEAYMYSATAVRLRELSLGYSFPVKGKTIKNLSLSVIGSNLFFFKKDAPFDPEQVSGVNPGGVGVDVFGLPVYRSIGFNLKCGF